MTNEGGKQPYHLLKKEEKEKGGGGHKGNKQSLKKTSEPVRHDSIGLAGKRTI